MDEWTSGRASSFPDMAEVAAAIAAEGVRPGIWMRSLLYREPPTNGPIQPWEGGYALDPSHPATLELVAGDVRQIRDWGFELIKHDFSTFEILRRWGFQMGARPAGDGLIPADQTRTTAEVIIDFYRTIREAAGDTLVLVAPSSAISWPAWSRLSGSATTHQDALGTDPEDGRQLARLPPGAASHLLRRRSRLRRLHPRHRLVAQPTVPRPHRAVRNRIVRVGGTRPPAPTPSTTTSPRLCGWPSTAG